MPAQSFTTTITVDRTPEDVFAAVNQPRSWWSTSIEGSADRVGEEFAFDSPGKHCWRFRVTELRAPQKIVWRVLDTSSTDFVDDVTEWNATEVHFDILDPRRADRSPVHPCRTRAGVRVLRGVFDRLDRLYRAQPAPTAHHRSWATRRLLTTGRCQRGWMSRRQRQLESAMTDEARHVDELPSPSCGCGAAGADSMPVLGGTEIPSRPAVVDRATGDAIAAARRRLPVVEVDAGLELIGPHGSLTLLDAFEGRGRLIAYYFMWNPACSLDRDAVAPLGPTHARIRSLHESR